MTTANDEPRRDAAQDDADVVIVGGGPVGMGLAIELGQRGVRCTVVERHAQPQPIPKGQNLTQRTMEHFRAWGAEAQLRNARTIPHGHGIGGLTAYGTLLSDYAYDWLQRDLVRPYYHVANERLPQYRTEAVLRQRVAELPVVRVLYGWEAVEVSQDRTGASVRIVHRTHGTTRLLRAPYAVGCDGSKSIVRRSAGIEQTRTDHDRLMVLLVFRSRGLDGLLGRRISKSYFNVLQPELEGYWKFFGRVDLEGGWFFHAPVPPGTNEGNFDFRRFLCEAVGAEFDVAFEHIGFWDLRFAVAERYRTDRLFIAGDAAHSHPPYGGYGLNSGLEDARNLGWKLAAVLQAWGGGETLLDSYDAERRPVFESTVHDFIERSIDTDRDFVREYDPARDRAAFEQAWRARSHAAVGEVHAFEPNYEGSPVVERVAGGGLCSARGEHRFDARSGHHLAPAVLDSGRQVFDVLGEGLTLLSFGQPEASARAFAVAADRLGVPLAIVQDGSAGDAASKYAAHWVLVRPDQFVTWVGRHGPADAAEADRVLRLAVGLTVARDRASAGDAAEPAGVAE